MSEMTSRERVLMAVEHKEPDRVPINFGGGICTSIVESIPDGRIYTKLCESLGYHDRPDPVTTDFLNIVLNVDRRVMEKLGSDMIPVFPGTPSIEKEADGVIYIDFDPAGTWKGRLLKELKAAGIDVDSDRALKEIIN